MFQAMERNTRRVGKRMKYKGTEEVLKGFVTDAWKVVKVGQRKGKVRSKRIW